MWKSQTDAVKFGVSYIDKFAFLILQSGRWMLQLPPNSHRYASTKLYCLTSDNIAIYISNVSEWTDCGFYQGSYIHCSRGMYPREEGERVFKLTTLPINFVTYNGWRFILVYVRRFKLRCRTVSFRPVGVLQISVIFSLKKNLFCHSVVLAPAEWRSLKVMMQQHHPWLPDCIDRGKNRPTHPQNGPPVTYHPSQFLWCTYMIKDVSRLL